jgi:hypothetical protein
MQADDITVACCSLLVDKILVAWLVVKHNANRDERKTTTKRCMVLLEEKN